MPFVKAVHGPLYHGRSRLTLTQLMELAADVAKRHGLFVHLSASPATLVARLKARGEPQPLGHVPVEALLARYDEVFAAIAGVVPILRIDTTVGQLPVLA